MYIAQLDVNATFTVCPYNKRMGHHIITDADIFRSAGNMIKRHGQEAVIVADLRANELLGRGNMDGYRMWKRIILVIGELSTSAPSENQWLH